MKRTLVVLAAVLLTGGCATGNAGTTAPSPAPSGSLAVASGRPVRPEPGFADLARGSTVSAVKLFAYEPAARSAVVEPIIFMGGAAYCKTYQVKRTDTRCQEEWTTEESRRKVTMTVAAKPALLTWQGEDGDVCAESLADGSGGTCPISVKAFGDWIADNPESMVQATVQDGAITKMALIYTS